MLSEDSTSVFVVRETGPAKHRSGKKRKANRHKKMNQKKIKQEPLSGPGN